MVTWRLARPERAARCSVVRTDVVRSASSSAALNFAGRLLQASAPVPTGRSQTRVSRPCAEHPDSRASARSSWPEGAAGRARRAARLRLGHHPAQVLLGADVGPVRRFDRRQPRGRGTADVGLSSAPAGRPVVDVGHPVVEALVDGDVERWSVTRSWSSAPHPEVGEPHDAPARRRARGQHRREVARRVAEAMLDLQTSQTLPSSRERPARPSAAGCRAPTGGHLSLGRHRGRRGRHELAHRDHVALAGQPVERAAHEDRSGPFAGAVAGLVATVPRSAGARLARADLPLRGGDVAGLLGLAGALGHGAER